MSRMNLVGALGVTTSVAGALFLNRLGRTYSNVALAIDGRRAEDELDAGMGQPRSTAVQCRRSASPRQRGRTAA